MSHREISIYKNNRTITFINNGIGFSQMGIAPEILDLIESQEQEIERLNNIIKIKTDFIEELLKIIAVARDYELHDKCYTRARLYEEKLNIKKENDNE